MTNPIPHEMRAAFDERTGALTFRRQCACGLRSGWQDTPEDAEDDRPANCRAHDTKETE